MDICVFSKHFQTMDAETLGRTMKGLGVGGVDLTVRRGGHVDPAKVTTDLETFQKALAKNGVKVTMLTTSILSAEEATTAPIIETAGRLGIRYIKLGYWHYKGFGSYRSMADKVKGDLKTLVPLLKKNGVTAGFHTHSGQYMGANAELAFRLIEDCDPEAVGIYYDTGHCVLEGSLAGWLMSLDIVSDRLVMVAVKNLAWFRMGSMDSARRGWRECMVPLDSGLTDMAEFVRCLKKLDFKGPVSFHSEYQGSYSFMDMTQEQVVEQTRKDLAYFRGLAAG